MKTTTSLTIDVELLKEARKRDINISKLFSDFLRQYLKKKFGVKL